MTLALLVNGESIANLTRADGAEFLSLAPKAGLRTHTKTFPLSAANEALRVH